MQYLRANLNQIAWTIDAQLLPAVNNALGHILRQNGVNQLQPMEQLVVASLLTIARGVTNEFGTQIVEERSMRGLLFSDRARGHQGT